jgi:hypothetical protein
MKTNGPTNKYPVYNLVMAKPIMTDEGRFTMTVLKEKCGHSFKIGFIQETFIMQGKTYDFRPNVTVEIFKADEDFNFVHDPNDEIESNMIQEVEAREFNFGFMANMITFRREMNDCVEALLEETRGNDYGFRN